jgi:PAS domain S-box-containing protein
MEFGMAVFSADGGCLFVNDAFAALINHPPGSPPPDLNFFKLIDNSQLFNEITLALKENHLWYGPKYIHNKSNIDSFLITFAATINPGSGEFSCFFLPSAKKSLETEVWDKLRDSEERYRILVELSPNLIQIHVNGEMIFINSAGAQILGGSSPDDFIGESIFKYIHPKEHEQIIRRVTREIGNREKMGPVEERWVRCDGSEFDAEVVALPFDYHGQVAVQVIAIDITERKQAREQLRQYTRQLLALNAIGLALVSSLNTEDILKQVTRNLTDILNASSLSILLKERHDFVIVASVGEDADKRINCRIPEKIYTPYLNKVVPGPIILSGEDDCARLLSGDTSQSILLERVMHNDDVIGIIQAAYLPSAGNLTAEQDILKAVSNWVTVALQNSSLYQTEQRQHQYAEGLLETANAINSNLNLPQVLERILQQVWRVIPCSAANIMVIEDREVRLVCSIGYDGVEKYPEWVETLHFPLDRMKHFQNIQKNRQPVIIPNTLVDPHWIYITENDWIKSYAAAPLIVSDRVYGFLNLDSDQLDYFNDDTIQRLQAFAAQASIAIQNAQLVKDLQNALHHEQSMRAQLVQSEKLAAMGRMVASVAHELNNPLQTIKNCLYIFQEGSIGPELMEYLATSLEEVNRLSRIVDQLREAYRPSIQTGKVAVKLGDLLDNVLTLLKPQLQHKHIGLVVLGDRDTQAVVYIDTMKQVFINLTQNAVEAMEPDGGTLTIELVNDIKEARSGICFRDTGRGISPEHLSNIFDPFFTTRETGFGLGLAICRDIIENHGGNIQVESEPGCGTTFSVWLPIELDD